MNRLANDASVMTLDDAAKHGLIDDVKYRDEILEMLSKKVKNGKKRKNFNCLSHWPNTLKKMFFKNQMSA